MENKIKYLELDNAFIDKLNVNKILVKNNKNIVKINDLNCSHLYLNDNDNEHIFISETENLDINIVLNTNVEGTKYIIKLIKKQKSLKISSANNDIIIGNYIFYNKTYINNINNSKKSTSIKSNDNNKVFYIPDCKYGLMEGSEIVIQYLNNKWILEGVLIGNIELDTNLKDNTYELILYICLNTKKIIYAITKNDLKFYFNKNYNNNINLFLNNNYSSIKLIDIKTNTVLYNNSQEDNTYNILIKKDDVFENLKNIGLNFINNTFTHIKNLYNITNNRYNNIDNNNFIEYKIVHNEQNIISNTYLNILDINAYYNNNINNNIELNTLIFDNYKGFLLNEDLILKLNF